MVPEIRYTKVGDSHVAYQVVGSGTIDIVLADYWFSHLDARWEAQPWARFMNRLAKIGRLIIFDVRGTGLSDPVPLSALPSLEEWMDDVRAVMDAAHSERAAIIGGFDAGPMAIVFAATHPDRAQALVLANTYARFARADDYPAGAPPEALQKGYELIRRSFRTSELLSVLAPSLANDDEIKSWFARNFPAVASPGGILAMAKMIQQIDVRHVLPLIRVPSLVLHRKNARWIRYGHGEYLAAHIPNARFVGLSGEDSLLFAGDQDAMLGEIEVFLTGARQEHETDRVLATVVFADLVDSTSHAARLGDRAWRDVLDRYYSAVRRELASFRGKEVDTAGDGIFAAFDGPTRAIRFAIALQRQVASLDMRLRIGLHTGECEVMGPKVGGIAVHIGARVMALAGAGEVLASSTVRDLVVGSDIKFIDRGAHSLKGIPGQWRLYAVALT